MVESEAAVGNMPHAVGPSDISDVERQRELSNRLISLLGEDLDFHDESSNYASHNFHSFPAKFPPQLPRKFIMALTEPGEVVLDPMMGSGTTILEAFLAGRRSLGFDIDPLAVLIAKVKVTPANVLEIVSIGNSIWIEAARAVKERRREIEEALRRRWDSRTKEFVDYWFAPESQLELLALAEQIDKVQDADYKAFFQLAFSALIVTKSGGVSLALDLGHTRPHRAQFVVNTSGEVVLGDALPDSMSGGDRVQRKVVRSPLDEFQRRFRQNARGLLESGNGGGDRTPPILGFGDARYLPLADASVSLVVTSPPYASNAIDYMRAHKFSLVWFGRGLEELSKRRREYIGSEVVGGEGVGELPSGARRVVETVKVVDGRKAQILRRYYSEMGMALREMFRVLKPGRAAIVVVGTSVMRGIDTEIATCLAEIGGAAGFEVPMIGTRNLDRDRRMMPVGAMRNIHSQIQQRMHQEFVIGFLKPANRHGSFER